MTISSHCHKNQPLNYRKIIAKLDLSSVEKLLTSSNENKKNNLEGGNLSGKDLN